MSLAITDDYLRGLLGPEDYAAAQPRVEEGAQGSITWLLERCGYVTASRFKDVQDFTKAGKESAKRAGYRAQVTIERITQQPIEHFVSGPMRDGTEREPMAKMAYEARTGHMLRDHGFRRHATIRWVGGSPDALIGSTGGLECKCPTPPTHLDTLLNGMDEQHIPQVQGLMWIFDAQWWDFCSYCPMFDEPLRTYIERIPRNDAYIAMLAADVTKFLEEVAVQIGALQKIIDNSRQGVAA